jgi:hypothetical protein
VRRNEFIAIGQKPAKLVQGDVGLARFHHHHDLFEVFSAIANRARMNKNPAPPICRSAQREPAGGRFGSTLRFTFGHNINLEEVNHEEHKGHKVPK